MDLSPPLGDVAARLIAACERTRTDYVVIGGLAAGAWGSDVATKDVDACLAIAPSDETRVAAILNALSEQGFRLNVEALRRRVGRGMGIFFLWLGDVRLDLMLRKGDGYWEEALANRRRVVVEGRDMWVAAPEDVIVTKLAAFRDKDREVVRQVARVQYRRLDLARLRASAAKLAWKAPELPARVEAVIADAAEIDRLASLPETEGESGGA